MYDFNSRASSMAGSEGELDAAAAAVAAERKSGGLLKPRSKAGALEGEASEAGAADDA